MKITAELLRRKGACADQLARFNATFGAEVVVTEALCVEIADKFDWDWAAERLFRPKQRRAYDEATAAAFGRIAEGLE